MANKIRLGRGTKARIETIKETLANYELVYSMDTQELGVKNSDGTVTYFGVVTELEWNNILNKPAFKTVATTGSYTDLTDKPDLSSKLDSDFTTLPEQTSPLMTDLLAVNRGGVAQKVTLANLLGNAVESDLFIPVSSLPATGIANKIYLLSVTGETGNEFEEYLWYDNKWEKVGSMSLDLSNYYTKTQVDSIASSKVTANTGITGATKTKITYDSKGLVTAGADLAASDIPVLSADKITSGTFADARIPSLAASKITSGTFDAGRIPTLAASKIAQDTSNRFVTDTEKSTWNAKLDANSTIDGGDL